MKRGLFTLTLLLPITLLAQDPYSDLDVRQRPARSAQSAGAKAKRAQSRDSRVVVNNLPGPVEMSADVESDDPVDSTVATTQGSSIGSYGSNAYQTQPATLVEDAPVRESKADLLRKRRQSVEEQTELQIVERLENERMKAEQKRAKKIIKNLDEDGNEVPSTVAQPVQEPVQTVVPVQPMLQPQYVAAPADASLSAREDVDLDKPSEEKSKFFVGGFGGIGEYPGVSNVRSSYGLGLTAGMVFPDRLIVEGGFIYSTYNVDGYSSYYVVPSVTQLDQMNFSLGVKYQITASRVRPVVGALTSYTRRSAYDRTVYGSVNNQASATSQAFDAGLSGGVDVVLSDAFSVGADLRYMFNITSTVNSNNYLYQAAQTVLPYSGVQIEKMSYYLLGVTGKFTF